MDTTLLKIELKKTSKVYNKDREMLLYVGYYRYVLFLSFLVSFNSICNNEDLTIIQIINIIRENNHHVHVNTTSHEIRDI